MNTPLFVAAKRFVPCRAKTLTRAPTANPLVAGIHVAAVSVDRNTLSDAKKRFVPDPPKAGTAASADTYFRALTRVQLDPLSVERKTPASVPTKTCDPTMPNELTERLVNPLFAGVHVAPLLVERKTPPLVPAKRFVAPTAKAPTLPP
jgi:hypothetical protein